MTTWPWYPKVSRPAGCPTLFFLVTYHLIFLTCWESQRKEVIQLLQSHPTLSGDVPSRTTILEHDIDVEGAVPIKQHAYRCPVAKREVMRKECEYLLENGLARPSHGPWSSPCLLAPKSNGFFLAYASGNLLWGGVLHRWIIYFISHYFLCTFEL